MYHCEILLRRRPNFRTLPLDLGTGTTIYPLVRSAVNLSLFDEAVRKSFCSPLKKKDRQRFLCLLKLLHYPLTNTEKTMMVNSLSYLSGTNTFIELDRAHTGNLYLTIHSGCKNLTERIILADTSIYQDIQDQFEDLRIVQALSELSRAIFAERLFSYYYGTDRAEEVCWRVYCQPYHHLDNSRYTVACRKGVVKRGEEYAFLAGNTTGIILLNNTGLKEVNGLVDFGLKRIRNEYSPTLSKCIQAVKKQLANVYCEKTITRSRYLSVMYQPLSDLFSEKELDGKICEPIYNFRPSDAKCRIVDMRTF